ncbi:MAG TPA: PAS domain S-box protein [Bryobacteraceae bacterium]|nr:PAS domain S-box protein [Bryobacteraceae bacterium]
MPSAANESAIKPGLRLWRTDWNWVPLLIAVCGWCATLMLCRIMISRERIQITQTASLAARGIQTKLASNISTHVAPLEALAARWSADADPWQAEWESEAHQLQQQYPAFQSISWVDAAQNVRWGPPLGHYVESNIRPLIDSARRTSKTALVPATDSDDHDRSLLVVIPISHRERFEGCVVATLPAEKWLHAVIDTEVPQGYAVSISDRKQQVYLRGNNSQPASLPFLSEADVNSYGLPWVVRVWPTPDEWTEASKMLVPLSIVIGLLMYAGGALAVTARREARTLEWAKQQMAVQQQELREANERMGAVIESSPVAIVAMDLAGNVKSWNPAAERMFGWTATEVVGQPPPFVANDEFQEFQAKIEQAASGEIVCGMQGRRQRKDGAPIEVEVWTAPLRDDAGSICGVISSIVDISEKTKLEEQLRHSQKMEAVGRLAGGVAHDFNNLLTIINGYGHMMVESAGLADRLRTHAEQILKAGNQAAALTAQLLAFSRRQMIQPKPVDLNHVITNLEKMLRRIIGEHITLRTVLAPHLERVQADPNQMEQVLINLAANARDAMPQGGTLTITTNNVELYEQANCEGADIPPGSYIELTVADNGDGMDAEIKSHLFEPFFTTKERGKGTGLGLSSVYGSIHQIGGGISVWSERGSGTAFRIYLPQVLGSAGPEPIGPPRKEASRGNETILLVEDEAPLRRMLRETLAAAGYHVLEASDGSDALHRWQKQAESIDLLLTDVVMPLLNGRDLAKRLTAMAPNLQVVFMSGYADDVIAYHGILEPGTILVQKPFLPETLLAKVREVLDARKDGRSQAEPLCHTAPAS